MGIAGQSEVTVMHLRLLLLLVLTVQLQAAQHGELEVVPLGDDASSTEVQHQPAGDTSESAIFGLLDKALGIKADQDTKGLAKVAHAREGDDLGDESLERGIKESAWMHKSHKSHKNRKSHKNHKSHK